MGQKQWNVDYNFGGEPWQCCIKHRQVCHCLWHVHMCICVSVFGLEEGDCWNLDCKQIDILSNHNKWSGVSIKTTTAKDNLGKAYRSRRSL